MQKPLHESRLQMIRELKQKLFGRAIVFVSNDISLFDKPTLQAAQITAKLQQQRRFRTSEYVINSRQVLRFGLTDIVTFSYLCRPSTMLPTQEVVCELEPLSISSDIFDFPAGFKDQSNTIAQLQLLVLCGTNDRLYRVINSLIQQASFLDDEITKAKNTEFDIWQLLETRVEQLVVKLYTMFEVIEFLHCKNYKPSCQQTDTSESLKEFWSLFLCDPHLAIHYSKTNQNMLEYAKSNEFFEYFINNTLFSQYTNIYITHNVSGNKHTLSADRIRIIQFQQWAAFGAALLCGCEPLVETQKRSEVNELFVAAKSIMVAHVRHSVVANRVWIRALTDLVVLMLTN